MRGADGKTFWERVIEALADQGVHHDQQTVVAKHLSIKQPSVWEWAREGAQPTMKNARELSKKLGVSTCWLLDGLGDKKPIPGDAEAQRLWAIWQKMSPATRIELLTYAAYLAARDHPMGGRSQGKDRPKPAPS
jgi:hypothetical protein